MTSALSLDPKELNASDVGHFIDSMDWSDSKVIEWKQIADFTGPVSDDILWEATLKFGKSCNKFLAPPTDICFQCGSSLQLHHEPTTVICISLKGPLPAQKVTLRCRNCNINYRYEQFGNANRGYRYYSQQRPLVHGSQMVYMERNCFAFLLASRYRHLIVNDFKVFFSHHAWVSFEAMSEIYNEMLHKSKNENARRTEQFFSVNPLTDFDGR